jgi:two-component system phosphate regulon sensor histidine kinase PhoR
MENHNDRPEIIQARLSGKGSVTRYSETLGYEMMYVAVPIYSGGKLIGYVRTALSLQQAHIYTNQLFRTMISATLLVSVIVALLAIWIARKTTKPLLDLTQATVQMAKGRMEGHLIPASNDEIGELTESFNRMADQLKAHIAALEAERSRMSAILEAITDGVIIVNTNGNIQSVNPAAESMFGIIQDVSIGNSLIKILRHHQIDELWRKFLSTGENQSITLEIPIKHQYLQVLVSSLGPSLPGNALLLFQDLTRMRRLETMRQDFVSNISHELRTPLASLRALTETLQEGALEDPPAARRFLQRIETEVNALSQIVEELLELSRIESGRVPLKMKPTNPIDLINQSVERLRSQAERARMKISIDCPTDLPLISADQGRLDQVLVNLLHNAIKFTPPGGEISITAQSLDGEILFSVKDTGIGISSEELPRIFERFYKVDRARSSGGTGLGLAIARHLVEAHGGHIWAESIEGHGSTFSFSIPLFYPPK